MGMAAGVANQQGLSEDSWKTLLGCLAVMSPLKIFTKSMQDGDMLIRRKVTRRRRGPSTR